MLFWIKPRSAVINSVRKRVGVFMHERWISDGICGLLHSLMFVDFLTSGKRVYLKTTVQKHMLRPAYFNIKTPIKVFKEAIQ